MVGISAIIKYCGATKQWYGGILALPCIAVDNTDVNKEDGKLGTGTYMEITILLFEKKKNQMPGLHKQVLQEKENGSLYSTMVVI
jgi:hypothetical protein